MARYPGLRETPDRDPKQRTEWNVRDSDASLTIVRADARSPGTMFAIATAERYAKPYLVIDIDAPDAPECIRSWLSKHSAIRALSIGGPRESEAPGIYDAVVALLKEAIC